MILPEGFHAAPLPLEGLLRPALVWKSHSGDGPPFTILRATADATVYWGCLLDRAGRVHDFLDIWARRNPDSTDPLRALGEPDRDERWRRLARHLREAMPEDIYISGWEEGQGPELAFDREGRAGDAICLNPSLQPILILRHAPLSLRDYILTLEGKKPIGVAKSVSLPEDIHDSRYFLASRGGRMAKATEVLLLKLAALRGAMRHIHHGAQTLRAPFLDLSIDHFGVRLPEPPALLASLWNAQVTLRHACAGIQRMISGDDTEYYLPASRVLPAMYQMPNLSAPVRARGTLRCRQVEENRQRECVLEGTLLTSQRLDPASGDLLELMIPLGSEAVSLGARLDALQGVAEREYRFRSLPAKLAPEALAALRSQGKSATFPDIEYVRVPFHSSPCDLYALGVIAVETLFAGDGSNLPAALDEIVSLAGRVADAPEPEAALAETEWPDALSPNAMLGLARNEPPVFFPPALWAATLAFVMRLLTGSVAFAYRKSASDAPAGAPHVVFQKPLEDLDQLIDRARCLLIADAEMNREIRAEIAQWMT